MKIAILTLGTRGDVQPYAVLGKAFMKHGHDVTICTAKNFRDLIASYGIPFVPVEADFQQLMNSEEGKKVRRNPFMAKRILAEFVYPMMQDAFTKFYHLAKQSDKVLFHVKTMADTFADQFPHKMIKADVVPAAQPTRYFPNPVFAALPVPAFLNRLTFKLTDLGLKMWMKPVLDFRTQAGLSANFKKPELPSIYGISEHLLDKPSDYPSDSYFTGFWLEKASGELPSEVKNFLSAGDPPLAITFGSMPFETKLNITDLIFAITGQLALRVILVRGWGNFDEGNFKGDNRVLVVDSAPYDLLFPFVKAVVHHGGVGTIAACLHAGKAFLSCPVLYPLGDQYFWGITAARKGVGAMPIPLKRATVPSMISAISKIVTDTGLQENARTMCLRLANEDGASKAVRIVEAMR